MTAMTSEEREIRPAQTGPADLAEVDNAIRRAEVLAVVDPTSLLADEVAAELCGHLTRLLDPAEARLARSSGSSLAAQRARDVLAGSIRHAQAVYEDQQAAAFTNPAARLYLLAGACRVLKNATTLSW